MTSANNPATELRSHDFTVERQRQGRRVSDSSSAHRHTQSPPPMATISPQITKGQKKPPNIRRMSTRTPHRGEEFSVDDDPEEVEEVRANLTPHQPSLLASNRPTSTIRRKPTQLAPALPRVDSLDEDEDAARTQKSPSRDPLPTEEEVQQGECEDETADDEEDADLSDTESFTLRDKQLAINETHPFGIRIWKPALYKKDRSVEKTAEEDIHSSPSAIVSHWLWIANCLWTLLFGWWLALAAVFAAAACFIFAFEPSAARYSKILWGLSRYLLYPFGMFVKLESDDIYVEEDEGEGRSISEYEQWQRGDLEYGRLMFGPALTHTGSIVGRRRNSIDSASERDSLLGRTARADRNDTGASTSKRRFFGRGQWTLGRVIFFVFFYFLIAPLLLLVSCICWLMVFSIPMGRVTSILFYHLRRHPLAMTFHNDATFARSSTRPSSILLCTYRAVGLKYWKYTVDGTNIFLINFLGVVVFVIFDYFILDEALGFHSFVTSPALLFPLALISIIPLAYFIGQAVASISAQSSMGMGAAVNAFFSTVVEVYLYCIALNEGKGKLVEGSLVGSIFAGVLLLPGLSMCFGAIKRKTQRFNVKSQSATLTMLLFATIAAFGPTLFFKIYGAVSYVRYVLRLVADRKLARAGLPFLYKFW
jgi:Ca2+:H+ antiporter